MMQTNSTFENMEEKYSNSEWYNNCWFFTRSSKSNPVAIGFQNSELPTGWYD